MITIVANPQLLKEITEHTKITDGILSEDEFADTLHTLVYQLNCCVSIFNQGTTWVVIKEKK